MCIFGDFAHCAIAPELTRLYVEAPLQLHCCSSHVDHAKQNRLTEKKTKEVKLQIHYL